MIDLTVLDTIREEKEKGEPGEKKHYIPFKRDEFDTLRKQFNKPSWMPNDFKLLLQAIGEGRITLAVAKKA